MAQMKQYVTSYTTTTNSTAAGWPAPGVYSNPWAQSIADGAAEREQRLRHQAYQELIAILDRTDACRECVHIFATLYTDGADAAFAMDAATLLCEQEHADE